VRKLAREAIIFILLGGVLTFIGSGLQQVLERHKLRTQTFNDVQPIESSAGPVQRERAVWIYVDTSEEFDGRLVDRPNPPEQITKMLKNGTQCEPGMTTHGLDKTEWVCVRPDTPSSSAIIWDADAGPKTTITPNPPPGYVLELPGPTNENILELAVFNGVLGLLGGLITWVIYRTVRFAVKG
jgi:hypothetical protein